MSDLVQRTTNPSDWDIIRHQAKVLVESKFLPKAIDTWQKATAVIMYGKELGIGPMEACQSIDVIQGKPTQKPQSMKAMVHKKLPTAIFRPVRTTDEEAVYEAARPGDPPREFSFTIKDAERLGLMSKDNWKKQPKVMLSWRCIGNVCRTVFPDCLSGVSYTPEELGAVVDDDHNVIELASEESSKSTVTVYEMPIVETKPEPTLETTPEEQEDRAKKLETYKATDNHKIFLAQLAAQFGVTEEKYGDKYRSAMTELSEVCKGKLLSNLDLVVKEYLGVK